MLKIVNEELMAYSTINVVQRDKEYTKIRVATSNKLLQYENSDRYSRNNTNKQERQTPKNGNPSIVSKVDAIKPINREIIRISAPLTNIGDFEAQPIESRTVEFDLPMTVSVSATKDNNNQNVEVRCHAQGDDRANLYVVAFPFNGMIKPLAENPKYRIYKGLIASSAKPFFFNNRKYRKVLYLVLEINKNLFNPEHKYHTDEIAIEFESYGLFKDRETMEEKTNHEVFTLRILSEHGDYAMSWDYETVDGAILMNVEPGQPLWTTYMVDQKKTYDKNSTSYNGRGRTYNNDKEPSTYTKKHVNNAKQHAMTVEGDMYVTTNRHGIRKEIPMKKKNNQHASKSYNNSKSSHQSIDEMMQASGMFDTDYDNRGKRNGGKRNKNKNRYN